MTAQVQEQVAQGTFSKEDIGVSISLKKLVEALNDTNAGTFAYIHMYQNQKGDVASYMIRSGVNYGALKQRSLEMLQNWNREGTFSATFDTWIGKDGVAYSRQGKKADARVRMTVERTFNWNDPRCAAAIAELIEGIVNPKETGAEYEKEGQGLYSLESTDKLYIRDCVVLSTEYHEQESQRAKATLEAIGEAKKPSCTDELGSIKKYIRNELPTGHYRSFFMDTGSFAYISIGGVAFMSDEHGELFQTLPAYAKQYAVVPDILA